MILQRASTISAEKGGNDIFTGSATIQTLASLPKPSELRVSRVSFEAGTRTNWHSHPVGQVLYVLTGVGRVQIEGQPVQEIRPGDTVWIEPNEHHWHGAAPIQAMTHLAIQEAAPDGDEIELYEPVTNASYIATPEEA